MTVRGITHCHAPTLAEDATLRDAAEKMAIYQFPLLVVVDGDRQPIAVLNEANLAARVRQTGAGQGAASALSVATNRFESLNPEAPIAEALELMLGKDLVGVPIVENGKLYGVLMRINALQALFEVGMLDPSGD